MKDWYLRQTPRDRLIVLVVGVLVVAGLLYAFVWFPVANKLDVTRRAIETKTETLNFVRDGGARIRAAGGVGGATTSRSSDKAPYLLVDELVRKAGVAAPDRNEPAGQDGARVQFGEVEFDKLIVVLAELETYGLAVTNMTLSRRDPGMVSARFNIEKS